jgi:hypothetical protein
MSLRAAFLIVAAANILHVSFLPMLVVLIGYGICAEIDKWLASREKGRVVNAVFDSEIFDWKEDPKKPGWEQSGSFTRVKLAQNEQVMVTRVAEILRRMLLAW